MADPQLPLAVTFYSYKGGAGRSVACANVAYQLVHSCGQSTVVLDFDVESAGQAYVHGVEENWILGRGSKYQDWIYVQEFLAQARADHRDDGRTETIVLARRGDFERFVPRMCVDLSTGRPLELTHARPETRARSEDAAKSLVCHNDPS